MERDGEKDLDLKKIKFKSWEEEELAQKGEWEMSYGEDLM